ncbi:MAG: hypothetical protein RL136_2140 [Planctomycetota bacterium]|jgi:flavin-dependent dehydrogenase
MMPSGPFDVVVIGAGPAGSSAAIAAARAGGRVLLAERSCFPRTKVCGCCLGPAGVAALGRLGAATALDGALPLSSVRVRAGVRSIALARSGGVAIGRDQLDARLVDVARDAGVAVLHGVRARVRREGRVELAADGSADITTVRCRTAIVADGLGGTSLDEAPGFAWRIARRSRMGFGAVLPSGAVDCPGGEIRMHVARGGYIGVVRLPDGSLDIAAAAAPTQVRAMGGVAACAHAMLGDDVRSRHALEHAAWRGTPLLTRTRRRIAASGILVAGDAAGYIEPFTGEGMTWAITAGAAAGALAATDPSPDRAWPAIHARCARGSRVRCRALASILRAPGLVGALLGAACLAPRPFEWFAGTIGREVHG